MLLNTLATLATLSALDLVRAADVHGSGALGTTMGPVAFLWPADRPWSADQDNVGPCGSSAPIGNRTDFPLRSAGSVSFSIADESYKVALRIAYGNNPTSQSDFAAFRGNVSSIEEGHQCYSVPSPPGSVAAGSNATIQLEYWGNDSGKDESFFACADITFVEADLFTTQVPCFNVTASEFTPAGADPSTSSAAPTSTPTGTASVQDTSGVASAVPESASGGLSGGAKAGIAVGAVVGAAIIIGAIFFVARRRRQTVKDTESAPDMAKVASFTSAETGQRK